MNAQEAIAEQLVMWDRGNVSESNLAASLLAMKQECTNPDCENGKVPDYDTEPLHREYKECPDCFGTGLSDLPVIAEVCPDQTLPPMPLLVDFSIYYKGGYTQAQQDMLAIRTDKDGRKVAFVKCYVE